MSESYGYQSFQVQHRHVYLAVLYSQLQDKNKFQMDYLERLLQPYYVREVERPSKKIVAPLNGIVEYWATPKVVNGRYLLFSQWEYGRNQEVIMPYDQFGIICEHRWALSAGDTDSEGEDEGEGVCTFCSTEFSITVTHGRMTVSTWKDLGTGKSPMDNVWHWDGVPGAVFRGPGHTSGSIRTRFEGA
ncbi:hypothetical protein ACHAPJ_010067 [Fusarium lateritium]